MTDLMSKAPILVPVSARAVRPAVCLASQSAALEEGETSVSNECAVISFLQVLITQCRKQCMLPRSLLFYWEFEM